MRENVSKQTEKVIGAKVTEAVGLLLLMKPLIKRAGSLTNAEQEVMTETVQKASSILHEAMMIFWKAREEPNTETAVHKNGVRP